MGRVAAPRWPTDRSLTHAARARRPEAPRPHAGLLAQARGDVSVVPALHRAHHCREVDALASRRLVGDHAQVSARRHLAVLRRTDRGLIHVCQPDASQLHAGHLLDGGPESDSRRPACRWSAFFLLAVLPSAFRSISRGARWAAIHQPLLARSVRARAEGIRSRGNCRCVQASPAAPGGPTSRRP